MDETGRTIATITLPKASGLLADRLRVLILSGAMQEGAWLPSERDLVVESGLSRGSVREALRILETEGLIETKLGRNGGARVRLPERAALARTVEIYVRARRVNLTALLDCRLAVEPMLARLAAQNRTEDERLHLHTLHRAVEAVVDDVAPYRVANFDWHLAIARASRNDPLTALMEAITPSILAARGFEAATTPQTRRAAILAHGAVMAAIDAGDGDAAARAMAAHLGDYIAVVAAVAAVS